jgi:biotin carboxylase
MRFVEAALGLCALIWVVGAAGGAEDLATLRYLARLGDVVDVSGLSPSEAAQAIAPFAPVGITCFVDRLLRWTAEVGEALDLDFHTPATADRLTDKLAQRTALREHGLPTPSFWDVDGLADDPSPADTVGNAFPLVLKPRRGTSSQDTERIDDGDRLRDAVAASEPGRMLLEGFIPDPTTPQTGEGSAPYVSVELLVSHGVIHVLGITGRTPLAPPFRETGFLFPADVEAGTAAELTAAAIQAARAVGVENGALHIELKCTDDGPVVIEINGRPGGAGVHMLLRRALEVDTVQLSMRTAVGERIDVLDLPVPSQVVFRLDVQPDAALRRITSVDGLAKVLELPGVEQVIPGVGPGDEISWRAGTLGFAAAVIGAAPDHRAVSRIRDEVLHLVVVSGTA